MTDRKWREVTSTEPPSGVPVEVKYLDLEDGQLKTKRGVSLPPSRDCWFCLWNPTEKVKLWRHL